MAFFWLQTVLVDNDGNRVKMMVDTRFDTVDEFADALSDGEIVSFDKIWTTRDENGNKVVTRRERAAIGADYVGMIQMPPQQPINREKVR